MVATAVRKAWRYDEGFVPLATSLEVDLICPRIVLWRIVLRPLRTPTPISLDYRPLSVWLAVDLGCYGRGLRTQVLLIHRTTGQNDEGHHT